MPPFGPIKRRKLIQTLRKLGFGDGYILTDRTPFSIAIEDVQFLY